MDGNGLNAGKCCWERECNKLDSILHFTWNDLDLPKKILNSQLQDFEISMFYPENKYPRILV